MAKTASVTIYHNPRCGKSRTALELLRDKNIEPTIIEYLKTPPAAAELAAILKKLGIGARDLMRTKEAEYKALKLDNPKLSETQLIAAMVAHPILIERPIVLHGGKAALGRPPGKHPKNSLAPNENAHPGMGVRSAKPKKRSIRPSP